MPAASIEKTGDTGQRPASRALSHADGLRYGWLGLPLAFVALPLYVLLPNHYAREYGVPLAALGAVLLGARLLDAITDPLIGRWVDSLYQRSYRAVLAFGALSSLVLLVGFTLLFFPQWLVDTSDTSALLVAAALLLVVTYLGFSAVSVAHQSWGALLGGDDVQRARLFGWREGLGLAGVVCASVVPTVAGLPAMVGLFAAMLALGWVMWTRAPRPAPSAIASRSKASLWSQLSLPWQRPVFRRLLAVFVLNGIASAVPATLVLFYVQDRLQAGEALEPAVLGIYFLSAALSIPLWLKLVPRWGLARTWLAGMALAVVSFTWAAFMGAGDTIPFLVVCVFTGAAVGTDLVLPNALLAGVIGGADTQTVAMRTDAAPATTAAVPSATDAEEGASGHDDSRHAGAYFGWWNFATKLNLALAAGLALPLLGLAGYVPGSRDPQALAALSLAYCVLPLVLKLVAGTALYLLLIRPAAQGQAVPA